MNSEKYRTNVLRFFLSRADLVGMHEQRCETRLLCSELVTVSWPDANGQEHNTVALLEDISASGVCVQSDEAVPAGETVRVHYSAGDLSGSVRYCRASELGYYVGVQFPPSVKWLQTEFRPDHLLDPRELSRT